MSHTPPIPFFFGNNSITYLTDGQPKNLVIFVHGYKGSPVSTWGEFPQFISTDRKLQTADVIFYGYDSLREQATNHSVRLYECFDSIMEKGLDRYTSHNRRLGVTNYEKIIIVGHSLGSIVIRRCLLNAKQNNSPWLEKCKMVLFAPAHRGSIIHGMIPQGIGQWILAVKMYMKPVVENLRPDSILIKDLIKDSEKYLEAKDGDFCKAFKVIWASDEKVVHNATFCEDPISEVIEHTNHKTVCKPYKPAFDKPFMILRTAI